MFLNTWQQVGFMWQKFLIGLTSGIYAVVNYAYRIFLILVHFNMFSTNDYNNFVIKVYYILGVIVLFVIASNLLTSIVDPDKNKGGKSIEKTLKTIFSSLLLIVICPFLFSMATRIQNVIIDGGTINSLFNASGVDDSVSANGAVAMEFSTFQAFFYGNDVDPNNLYIEKHKSLYNGDHEVTDDLNDFDEDSDWKLSCKSSEELEISSNVEHKDGALECDSYSCTLDCEDEKCSFAQAQAYAQACDDYTPYKWFAIAITFDQLDFHFLLSLGAGIYLVYVFIGFCFDVVSRLLKLFFYQIMSPLCIACRMVPSKEGVFKTWWTSIKNTYISVFVRIFVIEIGLWIISRFCVADNIFSGISNVSNNTAITNNFARLFLVLGIVTFIKQGPKIITDLFGLEEVQIGGLAKRFKEGASPLLKGAGAVGGAVLAGNAARKHYKNKHTGKNIGQKALHGVGSVLYGIGAGTLGYAGNSIWKGMKNNEIGKAVQDTFKGTMNNYNETNKNRKEREENRERKNKWKKYRPIQNLQNKKDQFNNLYDSIANKDNEIKLKIDQFKKATDPNEKNRIKVELNNLKMERKSLDDKMQKDFGVKYAIGSPDWGLKNAEFDKNIKDLCTENGIKDSDLRDYKTAYNQHEAIRQQRANMINAIITGEDIDKAMDKLVDYQKKHNDDLQSLLNKFAGFIKADFSKFTDITQGTNLDVEKIEQLGADLSDKSYQQIHAIANSLSYSKDTESFIATLSDEDKELFGAQYKTDNNGNKILDCSNVVFGSNFGEFQAGFAKWVGDGLVKTTSGAIDDYITGKKTEANVFTNDAINNGKVTDVKQHETYANADASLLALETMIDKSGIVQAISAMKDEFRSQANAFMKDGKLNVDANLKPDQINNLIDQMDESKVRKGLFDDISAIKNSMAAADKSKKIIQDLVSISSADTDKK